MPEQKAGEPLNDRDTHANATLKIVMVYQTNPFMEDQGGGVRYVKNLLQGLKQHCEKVTFLGVGERKMIDGNIVFIPITRRLTGYVYFLLHLLLRVLFMDLSRYDVVHVHRLYYAIPFIILKPHLKIICTLHGRTFSVFEANYGSLLLKLAKPMFRRVEIFAIRHIDYLVPVSQDVVANFTEKYGRLFAEKAKNMQILGSMIDQNVFKIQQSKYLQSRFGENNKYVLMIGRLAAVKNVEFLIQLWSNNFQNKPNIKLVIAGDGEYRAQLVLLAKNLCTINSPVFLGSVPYNEIAPLISSSEMVILASHHEASPTIIKESLCCGIPVVTSNVGDVTDFVVNSKNGFIVDRNIKSYYDAVNSLLENSISKENVLNVSSDQIFKCSVANIANKYLSIYYDLRQDQ
jgi:L-malate glycosyltransferase